MNMKRMLRTGTVLLLGLMLAAAGCSQQTQESSEAAPAAESSESGGAAVEPSVSNLTELGTFPIVRETEEMSAMILQSPYIEDLKTNEFTKYYEELTNIRLDIEVATRSNFREALNLRLANGDVPEVLVGMGVTKIQEMIYGTQGLFLPLNDLIDEHGFYIKQMFEDHPEYYQAIVTPDGNIYSLPLITTCYHCTMATKMWIYQPWLDKLGLQPPETTEDFYQMLKAFKERDPNGNGIADEIPFAGAASGGSNTDVLRFLMNAFVYTPYDRIYVDQGTVTTSFTQPGYKEGLKYLNKLYAEGLIAGESFTQDKSQLLQMGENPDTVILGAFPATFMGAVTQLNGPSGRWLEYQALAPLEGPEGLRIAENFAYQMSTGAFVITKEAQHPEAAFRWADGFFNPDVMIRAEAGVEDVDWRIAPPGLRGINGEPAAYQYISTYGEMANTRWYDTYPGYWTNEYFWSFAPASEVFEEDLEVILYNATKSLYEPHRAPLEMVLPPFYATEEISAELADLSKTIRDYVDQMTARFIMGDASIDAQWDTYLDTLDRMNLARFVEIQQQAYDAQN